MPTIGSRRLGRSSRGHRVIFDRPCQHGGSRLSQNRYCSIVLSSLPMLLWAVSTNTVKLMAVRLKMFQCMYRTRLWSPRANQLRTVWIAPETYLTRRPRTCTD
jgi:hypothetical protein